MPPPRPPGSRPRAPMALDSTLAVAAAVLAAVALVQRFLPTVARHTFEEDPGVRALGLALLIVAWMLWLSARLTATGTRRLLGRIAALGCALAAMVRIVGPSGVDMANQLLPPDPRGGPSFTAALALLLASAYVYFTSPARRRGNARRA